MNKKITLELNKNTETNGDHHATFRVICPGFSFFVRHEFVIDN